MVHIPLRVYGKLIFAAIVSLASPAIPVEALRVRRRPVPAGTVKLSGKVANVPLGYVALTGNVPLCSTVPLASFKETVTVPGPAGFTIAYTFTELRMNDCKASNTSPDSLFPLLDVDVVD
ncbi:hypothetical protein D3C86_1163850 [compost metagenome]